jgi:signal transduction histidine kinase
MAQARTSAEIARAEGSPSDEEVLAAEVSRLRARVEELEQAARREEIVTGLLAMMSHELRSPVQSLILNVETCVERSRRDGGAAPWLLEKLAKQRRAAARLRLLIDTFLDVGQIAAGELNLELQPVDLSELVGDVVRRSADDLAWAGCALTLDAAEPVVGQWDRLQLDIVVSNLLSNALKYGANRPIAISVSGAGDVAQIRVRDHGAGIAAKDRARIFQKFARLASSSEVGGFGLGLWIARHIVTALGGTIAVDSELGRGATFTISLPRLR